jgi:hypothetical protein
MQAHPLLCLSVSLSVLAASLSGCGPESDDFSSLSSLEAPQQASDELTTQAANTLYGYWHSSGGMNPSSSGNRTFFLGVPFTTEVVLNLTSTANAYLYLLDMSGNVLAQDDNGGGGTQSQLKVLLFPGPGYKVVAATATPGQRAEFTLSTSTGLLMYPQRLSVKPVLNELWVYDDRGSGADRDVSVWRPNVAKYPGYYSLGDVAVPFYGPHNMQALLVSTGSGSNVLAPPVDYTLVWNDKGSGGDSDGSFWKPIAPAGYTCLGTVTVRGYTKPSTDLIRCVKSEYVLPANATFIWSDRGSGADMDVTLYRADPRDDRGLWAHTFLAKPNYAAPILSEYWVLNSSAVSISY